MAARNLSSDHVNYLIWRYLQERGYGRTAVQFMRDWVADPQQLDFAPTVKPHTLISILQDGLTYDELSARARSRDLDTGRPNSASADDLRRYSFIDRRKRRVSAGVDDGITEATRKNPKLQRNEPRAPSPENIPQVAPPRSVRRKSSFVAPHLNGDAMIVDEVQVQIQPSAEEPKPTTPTPDETTDMEVDVEVEEPEPPVVTTLESGQSIGVQMEVQTTPVATAIADVIIPNADILQLRWSRSDSSRLLATGDGAFHTVVLARSPHEGSTLIKPRLDSQFGENLPKFVTATATPLLEDTPMAVAVEGQNLMIYEVDYSSDHVAGVGQPPIRMSRTLRFEDGIVVTIRWNPTSSQILALAYRNDKGMLTLYRLLEGHDQCSLPLEDLVVFDAIWVSDDEFIICGEGFISLYAASPEIQHISSLETTETWTTIKWDWTSHTAACAAASDGVLALLAISESTSSADLDDGAKTELAAPRTKSVSIKHTTLQPGPITAIEWQPQPQSTAPASSNNATIVAQSESPPKPRLLGTSSVDGTITIYSASIDTGLQALHVFLMGQSQMKTLRSSLASVIDTVPAMALAFSPDGMHVAAAGERRVCVWRAESEGKAVCIWDGDDEDVHTDMHEQAKFSTSLVPDVTEINVADQHEHTPLAVLVNGDSHATATEDTDAEGDAMDVQLPSSTEAKLHQQQEAHARQEMLPTPSKHDPQSKGSHPSQEQGLELSPPRNDPFHTLAWDVSGTRLAFARGDRVRVIGLDLASVPVTKAEVSMPPVVTVASITMATTTDTSA